ncbi:MAG: hypothetical protein EZS28_007282 [Streblomastix strix]|uniref:Uncharacterized protein n=1 Tax=Streblomastix strix TaxID=222440 RepID=A0A5J4WQ91_9EUKA|nr:MAG: hypothetical protein EZS28_007282 [Streblomastix strix]
MWKRRREKERTKSIKAKSYKSASPHLSKSSTYQRQSVSPLRQSNSHNHEPQYSQSRVVYSPNTTFSFSPHHQFPQQQSVEQITKPIQRQLDNLEQDINECYDLLQKIKQRKESEQKQQQQRSLKLQDKDNQKDQHKNETKIHNSQNSPSISQQKQNNKEIIPLRSSQSTQIPHSLQLHNKQMNIISRNMKRRMRINSRHSLQELAGIDCFRRIVQDQEIKRMDQRVSDATDATLAIERATNRAIAQEHSVLQRHLAQKIGLAEVGVVEAQIAKNDLVERVAKTKQILMSEIKKEAGEQHYMEDDIRRQGKYERDLILADIKKMRMMDQQGKYLFRRKNKWTK